MNVLGIKIDDISQQQALSKVEEFLKDKKKHYIVTPNPEIIIAAQDDPELKEILNNADLSIPDGVGLKLAGVKNRVVGVDLMLDLIRLGSEKGYSVGFIGGKPGVAQKASDVLQKKYPNLKIVYAVQGPVIPAEAGIYTNKDLWIPDQVRDDKVDFLFVAFGHGKQEKWIDAYLDKIPVKVSMTVGGSLDYVSGTVPRAPKPLRDLGLEWLFRLVLQPWRIKRQLALIKFVWLSFKSPPQS